MKNSTKLFLKKSIIAKFNSEVTKSNLQQKSLPISTIFHTFGI